MVLCARLIPLLIEMRLGKLKQEVILLNNLKMNFCIVNFNRNVTFKD